MIYLFLTILALNNIYCYEVIQDIFDHENILEGYITPEDNILIFSYNMTEKWEIYKYEKDPNSNRYLKWSKLRLHNFPKNTSDIIKDFYSFIKQTGPSAFQYSIFNEKNMETVGEIEISNTFYVYSLDRIGDNLFVHFSNYKESNNSISICSSFSVKERHLTCTYPYKIDNFNGRSNCYCVGTSNNNIVCGLIEEYALEDKINYNLILLQEKTPIEKLSILKYTPREKEYYLNGLFKHHFIKFIPLENDKIFYCIYVSSSKIYGSIFCGLLQVKNNSKIEILINNTEIFNKMVKPNYLRRNLFSGIKYNNNEVLLVCVESDGKKDIRSIAKLTISNNNTFIAEYKDLYFTYYTNESLHNYVQILKNKDNDIIFLIIYGNYGYIHEFGYSYCQNFTQNNLRNGVEAELSFQYDRGLFKGHDDDIVFINNTNV